MTSAERYSAIPVTAPAEPAQARTAGTQVSVEHLVHTYSRLLFRVAHAVLRNAAEAEDTVQDAFLRVLTHQQKLPDVENMRVWLVRIVWRLALDRAARITPGQMDDIALQQLVSRHLPADEALQQSHQVHTVLREMDRLPARERHALLLQAMEEMKPAEIALVLGKSESAVRALVFRARERLRQRLEQNEKRRIP